MLLPLKDHYTYTYTYIFAETVADAQSVCVLLYLQIKVEKLLENVLIFVFRSRLSLAEDDVCKNLYAFITCRCLRRLYILGCLVQSSIRPDRYRYHDIS